jgi:hypothetical protein
MRATTLDSEKSEALVTENLGGRSAKAIKIEDGTILSGVVSDL